MTPTLLGRIQTRWVVLATAGVAWTALVVPLLPGSDSLPARYGLAYATLLTVAVLGTGWEVVYHGLQQLRWDKDWPSLFQLLAGGNEAVTTWLAIHALGLAAGSWGWSSPVLAPFLLHFATTWLVGWLVMHGPLRVLAVRWRFDGARVR